MGKIAKNRLVSALVVFSMAWCSGLMPSTVVLAQEGHPYEGTWRGSLTRGAESVPVVIIMNYNGESIEGMINPGRNSYQFQSATHDAPHWKLDVTAQTRTGEPVGFSAVMEDIGSVNRFMAGTWTQAGQQYDFRITRE